MQQLLSVNLRPDLLTHLPHVSLVLRLPRKMHLCRSSSNVPRLPSFLEMLQNLHVLLTFDKAHNPLHLPRTRTSERPTAPPSPQFFALLTSKCASRYNGVHFFDMSTSKSGFCQHLDFQKCSGPAVFNTFDFEMCFAPQRRALFRHRNFQTWCDLYILTWKCASQHNGVQLFISHLARWLRTRRFSEPTFRPSGAPNHWKNTVFRDFPSFSRICIFFLLTLSLLIFFLLIFLFSLPLPCSAFYLSILSEV